MGYEQVAVGSVQAWRPTESPVLREDGILVKAQLNLQQAQRAREAAESILRRVRDEGGAKEVPNKAPLIPDHIVFVQAEEREMLTALNATLDAIAACL